MPASKESTVSWKVLSMLVVICIAVISSVAAMSSSGDAKLDKKVEKLDGEKVDKTVYQQHLDTQKEYRQSQKEQWNKIDKKLDKALGLE